MEEEKKPGQRPGSLRTLFNVITSPGEAFHAVAENPKPLVPVLIIAAVNLMVALVTLPKTKEFTAILLEQLKAPPEQIAASMKVIGVSTVAGAIVMPLLIWLLEAAFLKLADQFAARSTSFKSLFTVSVLAWVPAALGNMIKMVLVLMAPAKDLMLVQTSLAVLLPRGRTTGALFAVLSKIDPFIIWNLVLLAIGAGVVLKIGTKRAAAYVFVLWLVYVVLAGILGVVSGQKMPAAM